MRALERDKMCLCVRASELNRETVRQCPCLRERRVRREKGREREPERACVQLFN